MGVPTRGLPRRRSPRPMVGECGEEPSEAGGRPRLRVQIIERTALIRFEDAESLFDEEIVRALGEQLDRLIKDDAPLAVADEPRRSAASVGRRAGEAGLGWRSKSNRCAAGSSAAGWIH